MERSLITKLVSGMGLNAGQIVLLNFWGEEEERETLHMFAQEIAGVGAVPIEWMQSRILNEALFIRMNAPIGDRFYKIYDSVDVVVDLQMESIGIVSKSMPKEKFEFYRQHMARFFQSIMNKEKIIQITMPTRQNAVEANMEPEEYIRKMNAAFDLDYSELKSNCEALVHKYSEKNIVTVTSGKECKLTIDVTDRKWYIDAGDGALPCGEIYIAPVEGKSNGTVYFETLGVENVGCYSNVTVTIKDGKIVDSTCKEFNEFLADVPENGDVIAELGIGMNPNVTEMTGYSLLDEKIIGSFHIAIGENRMFGGQNACPFHMDFVTMGIVE